MKCVQEIINLLIMNRSRLLFATFSLLLIPSLLFGFDVKRYVERELKQDSILNNAIIGVYAVMPNGKVITDLNGNFPMLTASTMKTITTGLGLITLGPDYKYSTKVGYTGQIKDGILNGDLYLIGGGDPTLGSKDTIAYPIDSIFGVWTQAIKDLNITNVTGSLVVDDSFFVREQIPDAWSWGNIGTYYGSAASGLAFAENAQEFILLPNKNVGDTVKIIPVYPTVPNLKIINNVLTAPAKTGDRSTYYAQDLSLVSLYNGTIGIDRNSVKSFNSNKFPHLSAGWHFNEYLKNNGIIIDGGLVDNKDLKECTQSPIIISETLSPSLTEIIKVTNRVSNNFYAETILKTIGKKITGVGSYDSSISAVNRLMVQLGLSTDGFTMSDGSGLSRQNYVSPKFLCDFYAMIEENGIFAYFFESLPFPGGNGTLKNVLKNEDVNVKSKVHAKSGSLSGVRCYAGYVENDEGLIKFAILVNNYSVPTSKIQPKIEKFLLKLANYN